MVWLNDHMDNGKSPSLFRELPSILLYCIIICEAIQLRKKKLPLVSYSFCLFYRVDCMQV